MDEGPNRGENYYRLKQTDFDGQYSYSSIELVYFETFLSEEMSIYPNPSRGNIFVQLNEAVEYPITLEVCTLQGKKIWRHYHYKIPASQRISLNLPSSMSRGVYVLVMNTPTKKLAQQIVIE